MPNDPFDDTKLAAAVVAETLDRFQKRLSRELTLLGLSVEVLDNRASYLDWLQGQASAADRDRGLALVLYGHALRRAERAFRAGDPLKCLAHATFLFADPVSFGLKLRATGGAPRKIRPDLGALIWLAAQKFWELHPSWSRSRIADKVVEVLGSFDVTVSSSTAKRLLKRLPAPSRSSKLRSAPSGTGKKS